MGYFAGIELTDDMFMQDTLNDFISMWAKNMATSPKPLKFLIKPIQKLRDISIVISFSKYDVEMQPQY
jgi:fumarylacetoacetase